MRTRRARHVDVGWIHWQVEAHRRKFVDIEAGIFEKRAVAEDEGG